MHCTKSLFNLVIIGVLPLTGMILGTANPILATSIICPNAPKAGDYSLCSENYDSSFMVGKQMRNLIDSEDANNDRSNTSDLRYRPIGNNIVTEDTKQDIYCSSDIDVAIMDTSLGGDLADMVCESRSRH